MGKSSIEMAGMPVEDGVLHYNVTNRPLVISTDVVPVPRLDLVAPFSLYPFLPSPSLAVSRAERERVS